jgi:hypothetical protein
VFERRVFADRAEFIGDMDFVPVPIDTLISDEYAFSRWQSVDSLTASLSTDIAHGTLPFNYHESEETTHYSVVDKWGNAVSVTTTINGWFGNGIVVDGAGFLLNNEMDDFSSKPGIPNAYGLMGNTANAIEPGKRMLSSMSPSIVETPNGELFLVVGSPGGSTIITTTAQIIMNVVDYDMNIEDAVVIIVEPPGEPTTKNNSPLGVSTIEGDMELSMRFPGSMALAVFPISPYALGMPGFDEKSSISLFRRKPAPSTTIPFPNQPLMVVVTLTAFPHLSTTE